MISTEQQPKHVQSSCSRYSLLHLYIIIDEVMQGYMNIGRVELLRLNEAENGTIECLGTDPATEGLTLGTDSKAGQNRGVVSGKHMPI